MSVTVDLQGKRILKGKPYLVPLPENLKLKKDGIFLGEEIFLIENKGQMAVIFLNEKYNESYKYEGKEINFENVSVLPESLSEKLILKDLAPNPNYSSYWFFGVLGLALGLFYLFKYIKSQFLESKRLRQIKEAVKDNDFEFILRSNALELEDAKKFLLDHLYKKEWESIYKDRYENIKKEFLRV